MAHVPRHTHRAPHAPPRGGMKEVVCRAAERGSVRRENRAAGWGDGPPQAHCRLVSVRSRTLDIAPSAARICVRAAHDAACAARPGVGARVTRLQLLTASASVVHGRSDRPARRSRELLGACRRGAGGVRGCHRAPVGSAVADWVVRAMVRSLTGPAAGACGTARSTRERVELGGACRLAGVLT